MPDVVEEYYDANPQIEWDRMNRHRTEFAVTFRALQEFLPPPPCRVIDIGGGPGRYAVELARMGYGVTLLDLSSKNLQLALQKAEEAFARLEAVVHGNALSLTGFGEASFDAVLLMGPLYHLVEPALRLKAVREAIRVLRPGGVLFAAFISRYAVLRDAAKKYPEDLFENSPQTLKIIETGVNEPESGFTAAYFSYPSEIIPMMESVGLKSLALLGAEGIVAGHEEKINELSGEAWEYWVNLNYHLSHDPALLGAADHLIYIGRKPEPNV